VTFSENLVDGQCYQEFMTPFSYHKPLVLSSMCDYKCGKLSATALYIAKCLCGIQIQPPRGLNLAKSFKLQLTLNLGHLNLKEKSNVELMGSIYNCWPYSIKH